MTLDGALRATLFCWLLTWLAGATAHPGHHENGRGGVQASASVRASLTVASAAADVAATLPVACARASFVSAGKRTRTSDASAVPAHAAATIAPIAAVAQLSAPAHCPDGGDCCCSAHRCANAPSTPAAVPGPAPTLRIAAADRESPRVRDPPCVPGHEHCAARPRAPPALS